MASRAAACNILLRTTPPVLDQCRQLSRRRLHFQGAALAAAHASTSADFHRISSRAAIRLEPRKAGDRLLPFCRARARWEDVASAGRRD
jgi:hypothetical protein